MKICIVTTRHISYNPRVLKEADVFAAHGIDVSVVTVNNNAQQARFDEAMMKERKWRLVTVNFRREIKSEKLRWLFLSLQEKIFSVFSKFTYRYGVAERASLKGFSALARLAKNEEADFYIAHHAEALGIAYAAAKNKGVRFGFDAEDFHTGMSESGSPSDKDSLLSFLEGKYLPHAAYITAASKGIGEAYEKKYGLAKTTTILNVFPKEATTVTSADFPVKFYWYSQVIGPNRSLETLLEAASQIDAPYELHLRGSYCNDAYKEFLQTLIKQKNLQKKVFIHPPIVAERIITDASKYDVGLALETDVSYNRDVCVTNKIFSYLMAGLAIVGTDTYGQKDIFSHFKKAVLLCGKNNADELAQAMLYFIQHPEELTVAKRFAKEAAEERFNWEVESEKLLTLLEEKAGVLQQGPLVLK
ncbi:glycosyltransferase family protein [Flavisolibacter ginsenosidimutans]|uniref:Glycosyltransferase family 4 protein n=1 Tax=Flavisolibacter ginsenosidimutans TaxID=661481 RepID=A0A5B8UEG3_9BACT|nr:glycosyltransferase [Flavisolibacter ginsenosidimutans]QEC54893.1 glycosyltransferase family 4 protein [Flavisolibacter ginsenosidimutans]